MLSITQVLSSTDRYKQAFAEGLTDILQARTAGTFILACANIFQHPELLEKNKNHLREVYAGIEEYYLTCSSNNQQPDDSADDISVMNKIITIGFDKLEQLQNRHIETDVMTFQVSFNQLRSFRPARMSTVKDICLNTGFKQDGFHFNKAFLKKEMFAEGEYLGRQVSLLYNKFPFVKYHALLVVDKAHHINQYLSQEHLAYIVQLQTNAQEQTPELVITYNSLGAGASVNHLHFQVFLETDPLSLFSPRLVHNGGRAPYPASCNVFTDTENCWRYIQTLHTANVPYNLLFKNKKIYCLPRKMVHKEFSEIEVSTFGWSEMAGAFTINNKDVFKQVTADKLIDTIKAVTEDAIKCTPKETLEHL